MRYCLIGLWLVCRMALAQPDPFPQVAAAYQVEINGVLLWQHAPTRRLPPASLTKLMTALLVLDGYDPQVQVTISHAAARESGTRLGVRAGERYALEDLLTAALLASDNDACHALADHMAGDEAHFVQRMNRRARELGMHDTRFANACGHDQTDHYSTAHDLALLAHAAMSNAVVRAIVAQSEAYIATPRVPAQRLENKNALIGRYPGALGVKSGYTPRAGKCLIAYARRNGSEVLLVLLNAPKRWWDAADILDLAFAHGTATP